MTDQTSTQMHLLRFHEYLEQSFPMVREHASKTLISGYSLVYHIAGSDSSLKPVLFMGHMDVVPVDDVTLAEWTHDPFARNGCRRHGMGARDAG